LLAEFTYNNTLSITTGISPFFTNKGFHPSINIYPEQDITLFCICKFATDLDELQGALKIEISTIQQWC